LISIYLYFCMMDANKYMTNASKGAIKKRRRDFQVSWLDESSFKG